MNSKLKTKVETKHVVMFSGGAGSWAAAKRVAAKHGTENLTLLFADTLIEDPDLYRFLEEAAEDVGGQLVKLVEGRTPWEVFKDVRFLGNSRVDPCSRILKRDICDKWLEDNCEQDNTIIYLGIDWTEQHRFVNAKNRMDPWVVEAPLCEPPYTDKEKVMEDLAASGIETPDLYKLGFPHNNCGGFCIKAGQAHFKLLMDAKPEYYQECSDREQVMRDFLQKDVSVLRDRRGGVTKPLTLEAFRARVRAKQADEEELKHDWGGCGCFLDAPEETT